MAGHQCYNSAPHTYSPLLVGLTLFLLGLCSAPSGVEGEVFSSMATLRSLVSNQGGLLTSLEEYIEQEEARLQELRG